MPNIEKFLGAQPYKAEDGKAPENPGIKLVDDALPESKPADEQTSIAKPESFSLEDFRSTRPASQTSLPF